MARSLSLIKNGERESEVHFLFFFFFYSSFLHSVCTLLSSQDLTAVKGNVQYLCIRHYIMQRTAKNQNSGQACWKATERGKKKRHDCFFFILCNDNDIIDMNNAVSDPFFSPFFFYIPMIFTLLQKPNMLSYSSLHCQNITIWDVLISFQLLSGHFCAVICSTQWRYHSVLASL